MTAKTFLVIASEYASCGWLAFPIHNVTNGQCSCPKEDCTSPAKHPRTKNGLKDASVDPKQLGIWWRRWPEANIGIRTGPESGIVVVDVDPRHGGNESFDQLLAEHGELPKTVEAETGGGGRHLFFQHPGGQIGNRTGVKPGIDFRGDGGYIIAPPSIHFSGGRYAWKAGHALGDQDLAVLPPSLLELFSTVKVNASRPSDSVSTGVQDSMKPLLDAANRYVGKSKSVSEGGRNNAAFNLAGHLAAFQSPDGLRLDETQIVNLLRPWNEQNQPPLSDEELVRTVRSAMNNGTPRQPHIVNSPTQRTQSASKKKTSGAANLPEVLLPGGAQRVTDSAVQLGNLLAATKRNFLRGGAVVKLVQDENGARRLQPLKPAAMPAVFEQVARLVKIGMNDEGKFELQPTVCNESKAKIILHSEPFQQALPPIHVVTRCPVLVERDNNLIQIHDYDRKTGILADSERVPDVPLEDARRLLRNLLDDFRFAAGGDRSRALAAMITPALVFGGLLGGRSPMDLTEADQSQTGKGYRNKITAAIYREKTKMVTQRRGGVGSLDETFNAAVISGAPFICLDNVRGKIDSPAIESFLTEDRYLARIPYSGLVEINPSKTILMLTSNRAELTPDLANRSSCVRLLKRPPGYMFQEFPEGDLLDHVKTNQPMYLGAVFSIIKAWHASGKPSTKDSRHDFRRWAGVVDWIVQYLLESESILEGHQETQSRMTNPALTWLRDVALAVEQTEKLDHPLRAHQLLDILAHRRVEIPGIGDEDDLDNESTRERALLGIGKHLRRCFTSGDFLKVDHMTIRRKVTTDSNGRQVKEYLFSHTSPTDPP